MFNSGSQMSSATVQFGLMNSLRTGNAVLDMVVCMLLPIVFRCVNDMWDTLLPHVKASLRKLMISEHVRIIEYKKIIDSDGDMIDNDSENDLLQEAILMFIAHNRMEFRSGNYQLTTTSKDLRNDSTHAAPFQQYTVKDIPPLDDWVPVIVGADFGGANMMFRRSEDVSVRRTGLYNTLKTIKTTFELRMQESRPLSGKPYIDDFLVRAFKWHTAQVKAMEDWSRYMYNLETKATHADNNGNGLQYRRYKLSDEKTFASIFFDEKEELLNLVADFQEKKGKFSVEGFPQKLGLLLHGPPGTGKTSLIKALAEHTNRHIVSISLSRIRTNQQLMDIVFGGHFRCVDEGSDTRKLSQIIFVMEDIDCANGIVQRRDGIINRRSATSTDHSKARYLEEGTIQGQADACRVSSSPSFSLSEGGGNSTTTTAADVGDGTKEARSSGAATNSGKKSSSSSSRDKYVKGGSSNKDSKKTPMFTGSNEELLAYLKKKDLREDRLNLAGLLNVLDGVVDCPGRMVVMTSNHPENLDPALLRPGRVNKVLYMGYSTPSSVVQMTEHYFGRRLTDKEQRLLISTLREKEQQRGGKGLSPAQIEQLCAESFSVNSVIRKLRLYESGEDNKKK